MRLRKNSALRAALLCLLLTSCKVGPDYHTPALKLPDQFAAPLKAAAKPPTPQAAEWWKALGDTTLNRLIDRAIANNPDLEIALTRLQEARTEEVAVEGGALPMMEVSAGAGRGTGSDLARGRASQTLVSAEKSDNMPHVTQIYGFDATWQIDLFGQYRREMEAAHYDTQAALAARNDVLVALIADVVRTYADLRGLQLQQIALKNDIDAATRYTNLVQKRYDYGITNGLDLTLARREQASLESEAAPLAAQIAAAEYTIAVLCGDFPENAAESLSKPGPVLGVPETLSTGVPLDVLRTRPDVREAERTLASANARIGVATANLFPHFAIMGGAGYQGQGLGVTPVMNKFIWSAGPSVSMPILDFGTLDAEVNIADLETHALLIRYKLTVLDAVKDVDEAASNYAAGENHLKNLAKALAAGNEAVSLAQQRYDRGLTDALNVVDAERQQYAIERQYIAARQEQAEAFVALYRALGEGWEKYQQIPPPRTSEPAVIAMFHRLLAPEHPAKFPAAPAGAASPAAPPPPPTPKETEFQDRG